MNVKCLQQQLYPIKTMPYIHRKYIHPSRQKYIYSYSIMVSMLSINFFSYNEFPKKWHNGKRRRKKLSIYQIRTNNLFRKYCRPKQLNFNFVNATRISIFFYCWSDVNIYHLQEYIHIVCVKGSIFLCPVSNMRVFLVCLFFFCLEIDDYSA